MDSEVTIRLTPEQHEVLLKVNRYAAPVLDSVSGLSYEIVPKEIYCEMVKYDDSEFDISEAYPLMAEVAREAGWCDPEMDIYDKLYPRPNPEN
jgi:predicted Mrr-cat superfamily restriction endonuclease